MKIRILASSDIHGAIMPYHYSDNKPSDRGFAKLKATMDRYTIPHTLRIDNGDILEGSPLLAYHYKKEQDKVNPMIACLNMAHYDYFNVGNHDLNYGQANLLAYIKAVKATCLCGNILYQGVPLGQKYLIHHFDENHKIALIGAVTDYLLHWEKAQNLAGFTILNAFDFIKATVAEIKEKEKVDGIVVVYHGGFECDPTTGIPTENLTGENVGYKICQEIKGIDLLLTGHQHRSLAGICHQVHYTQTTADAKEIALIDWDLQTHAINQKLIPVKEKADEALLTYFAPLESQVQKWLDEDIGEVKGVNLLIKDGFAARLHKHPVISLINEIQRSVTGADLAGNALFNEAIGFREKITMRDIVSTYVYPNTLVVFKINGRILKEYLEKAAEYFALKDGKITVAESFLEPKAKHYDYDMVDGITYTIKVSNVIGQRIIDLKYRGKDVKENDTFTLALSNYRASSGGDYFMFKKAEIVKEIQTDMVTLIADYLQSHRPLSLKHEENIKVII